MLDGAPWTVWSPGPAGAAASDSGSSADLRIVSNTQPAHGTATCSALGACFYKADAGSTQADSFTYTARDAAANEDTATVTVSVTEGTAASDVLARDDDLATIVDRAIQKFHPTENDSAEGTTFTVGARCRRYSSTVRSGVRSSGSASSISLVKMRSERL